jgi:metal-dependent amidase/aminoacylase/carboxypeptidase family protein
MHACGHNMWLVLANKTESWQGTVFICAQPAEETPQMCEFLPNMIYS